MDSTAPLEEREALAQGAPLLVGESQQRQLRQQHDGQQQRHQRYVTGVAGVCLAGLCVVSAIALGRRSPAPASQMLPRAALRAGVQLQAVSSPPADADDHSFANIWQAFQALHHVSPNSSASAKLKYAQFRQAVAADQQSMILEQGPQAVTASSRYQALMSLKAAQDMSSEAPATAAPMELAKGPLPRSRGFVKALYTYGAPATSKAPVYDATQEDGCFAGLRVYTRGTRFALATGAFFRINDPVAWVTRGLGFQHARMESLELLQGNDNKHPLQPCGSGHENFPVGDNFWWFTGHSIYAKVAQWHLNTFAKNGNSTSASDKLVQEKLRTAHLMAHFAFMNYELTQKIAVDAPEWGWRMVGRSCSTSSEGETSGLLGLTLKQGSAMGRTVESYVPACKDHVILYQHDKTLDCALVFEGSDDGLDWLANLDFATSDFCTLGKVHQGFRAKVLRMVGGIDYAQIIRSKLPQCASVTATGHSLGGAQAELFTACANKITEKGQHGFAENRLVSFKKDDAPSRIPDFLSDQAEGVFLRNRGNGLCVDVEGTAATELQTNIMIYTCELPGSTYSKDQRWELTPDGLLRNQLSGKCIDGDEVKNGGATVKQWPCKVDDNRTQAWELTPDGFLLNQGTGRCIDSGMSMYACPYTDQRWKVRANGQVANRLSGLCLGVDGRRGSGDAVVLRRCKKVLSPASDQAWKLTASGALKSRLSGLCVATKNQQGRENRPDLVLGPCNTQKSHGTVLWELTTEGFFKSKKNGKCMDVEGKPGMLEGDALKLAQCEDRTIDTSGLWKMMPGGFIKNVGTDSQGYHQCIQVAGRSWEEDMKAASGTPLVLALCKINTDQKWQLTSDGFIRSVIGGRKCLDIRSEPMKGMTAQLLNCDDWSDPALFLNLKWELTSSGLLRNKLHLSCMSAAGESGLLIDASECKDAWKMMPSGLIVHRPSSKCLDVTDPQGGFSLASCGHGSAARSQRWEFAPSGILRNTFHDLCAGILAPSYIGGTRRLALTSCPVSTMRWDMGLDGLIRNKLSGTCLEALRNESQSSWWQLTAGPCNPTLPSQQWEQVPP
mmetsp:Transcript_84373/g.239183  ORF Transcript_84373/g.239183 Transcript_84373/m.239183 type:complete len:1065 (-) Transcript_84373:265-3459(-)